MAQRRITEGEFGSHLAVLLEKIGQELEAVKAEQEALRQRQERLEHQWQTFSAELGEYWRLYEKQSKTLRALEGQLRDFLLSNGQQLQSLRVFTSRLQDYLKHKE